MKTTNKINLVLAVLLLPLFAVADGTGEPSTSGTNSAGIRISGDQINLDNGWAINDSDTNLSDVDADGEFRWRGVADTRLQTDWAENGTMGDVNAFVTIRANAENACTGGADDECGAYMQLKQTSTDGVQNDSTISMEAKTVSIAGKVNLGQVGTSGTSVFDLGAYVTTTRSTTATNTTGIATNVTNLATNTAGIATNVTNLATNTTGIATNVTNIATNTAGIATNKTNVATNTAGIATNVTNIATNTAGIATNKTNVATNTAGVATNVTNIAANTSLISANTATLQALIGINGTGIQSLASSFTSFQEDTNRNFVALSGNMYEGLAEVTAISNVAYASSGWRASVGYGDYKNKSATAIGISYAGEKYKFKFSNSGDATGFGISYDF